MTDTEREPTAGGSGAETNPQLGLLYRRVLAGETGLAQVWFGSRVLDRYRGQPGVRVIRTDTAGRIRVQGGWTLDFGIADKDRVIHVSAADLAQRLPAADRPHWLGHILAPPVSGTFLVMRLGAGHCIDDGDVRDWPG